MQISAMSKIWRWFFRMVLRVSDCSAASSYIWSPRHIRRKKNSLKYTKKLLRLWTGKRVIIRTLDIGADKQADYFELAKEENPAMGVRAIRICLTRPEIFKTQLRALFRASCLWKHCNHVSR